jgi:hypothetical protein
MNEHFELHPDPPRPPVAANQQPAPALSVTPLAARHLRLEGLAQLVQRDHQAACHPRPRDEPPHRDEQADPRPGRGAGSGP